MSCKLMIGRIFFQEIVMITCWDILLKTAKAHLGNPFLSSQQTNQQLQHHHQHYDDDFFIFSTVLFSREKLHHSALPYFNQRHSRLFVSPPARHILPTAPSLGSIYIAKTSPTKESAQSFPSIITLRNTIDLLSIASSSHSADLTLPTYISSLHTHFKSQTTSSLNMSGKLDQSLDEILSTSKKTRTRRGGRVGGRNGKPAAPVGGVAKSTRGGRGGVKAVPTGPAAGRRSVGGSMGSKAIISNLVSSKMYIISSDLSANTLPAVWCERVPDKGMLSMRLYKPLAFLSETSSHRIFHRYFYEGAVLESIQELSFIIVGSLNRTVSFRYSRLLSK